MAVEKKICILDYGSGNVKSVYNLCKILDEEVYISHNEADIELATHLILPGVGAFSAVKQKLFERISLSFLKNQVFERKKPFLGICVGMQLLASQGTEGGFCEGLGFIEGTVEKLDSKGAPLPHIGWNNVSEMADNALFDGISEDSHFYFVHSYHLVQKEPDFCIGCCEYGTKFTAAIRKNNIVGVQFHPEKSQLAGKRMIKNFLENIK